MKFTPRTEDDLKRENLCPEGLYPFTVLQAADAQSKTGKDMIKLKLNVHGDDGFDYHVYDYISPDFMPHKLRHFAFAVGIEKAYEAGSLCADDCQNRQGWCDVGQKDDKQYGPKNVIRDYAAGDTKPRPVKQPGAAPSPSAKPAEEDDQIPF